MTPRPGELPEVTMLRENMTAAADQVPLPSRFKVAPNPTRPRMLILDTQTGRSVEVPLCDYGGARRVLSELFPDPEEDGDVERWRTLLLQALQMGDTDHVQRCRYMLRRMGADPDYQPPRCPRFDHGPDLQRRLYTGTGDHDLVPTGMFRCDGCETIYRPTHYGAAILSAPTKGRTP